MLLDGTGVPTTGLSVDEVAGLLITTFDDVEDVLEIEITGVLANSFGVEVDDDEGGGLGTGLLAETGEAMATGELEGLGRTGDDAAAMRLLEETFGEGLGETASRLLACSGEATADGLEGILEEEAAAAASGAFDTAPNESVDKEVEEATIERVPCDA